MKKFLGEKNEAAEIGQLVKISEKISDFYPEHVNKIGFIIDIVQYSADTLTGNKEFVVLIDGKQCSIHNSHPTSTVSIDGLGGLATVFRDHELFKPV